MKMLSEQISHFSGSATAVQEQPPLDMDQLLRRCMGRLDLATRLLASFERRFPSELSEIERCLEAQDVPRLVQLAHQLKGASANISAPHLHRLMQQLEEAAQTNLLADAAQCLAQLQSEWERFLEYKGSVCF